MSKRVRIFSAWLAVTALIVACMPSFLTYQAIPTPLPGALNLFIAQTAAVAATQTALLAPPTLTPTLTPSPTKTPSPTASPTPTFIFKLSTPTVPIVTKTLRPTATIPLRGGAVTRATKTAKAKGGGGGGGGQAGKPPVKWSCGFLSQLPTNDTHYATGASFNATWTVQNTGDQPWTTTTVDEVVTGGTVMTASAIYDVTSNTGVGSTFVIDIPMTAPSAPGTYATAWSLKVGQTLFCPVSLRIIVP